MDRSKIPMMTMRNHNKVKKLACFNFSAVPVFILLNLVLTVNGVCLWENGKLECEFHQSEIFKTGSSPSASSAVNSSNLDFNYGPSVGDTGVNAPPGPDTVVNNIAKTKRSDSARLLWTSGYSNSHGSRFSKPQPKVVRISQHRPSANQPSGSYFSRRFLPLIDTEDEDLVSVSQVQVHEPQANPGINFGPDRTAQQDQVHNSQKESMLIDGVDYAGQVEVSYLAFPQGNRDLHDSHTQDAPSPPPRRHDSDIEEIHSILPSLLDPVRIKKIIYPKNRRSRLNKNSRSSEEEQPDSENLGQHGQGPEPVVANQHEYESSSYSQVESHGLHHGQLQHQVNSHLQNSKTLTSPFLFKPSSSQAGSSKKKPFRIQILDSKQEHQKPGTGFGSYTSKKSTLLMPATKEYHHQYKVPYKGRPAVDYVRDSEFDGTAAAVLPTQFVPMNHHDVYSQPQQLQQEQNQQSYNAEAYATPQAPAPTPILSTGPLIVHGEHLEAELRPMLPPLPQPEAFHSEPPADQMMSESINMGQTQGFYHQQQYLSNPPVPSQNPTTPYQTAQPYHGQQYSNSGPDYSNQYSMPMSPAPAPAPAPYFQGNYYSQPPAPGPTSWTYNSYPQHYASNAPTQFIPTGTPTMSEKESVLNALRTLSQSKPDLIKDVVSEHKHEGLGDDVVEFVSSSSSSQKENNNDNDSMNTGSASVRNQTNNNNKADDGDTHFYTKKGIKNKITVDVSSVENPDPKVSMPIDEVLSLLLSNQKYSSSGKNYFKNSFTQEMDSGTKNHPNELANVLYDMGILQRIATGTLTVEQMELVNKLIDLNHQEQELEEEIEFVMDKSGRVRKKKPAKYLVPRTASPRGGSAERDQLRSGSQSSYSAYDDKREEYEKRRRPNYRERGYGGYSRYQYHDRDRSREGRDGDRDRERDQQRYDDRPRYRGREQGRDREMLFSSGYRDDESRYHDTRYQTPLPAAPLSPAPDMQPPPQPRTEAPVNLNIIIPTEGTPTQTSSLNDAIPSDTMNLRATFETGQGQGYGGYDQPQQQQQREHEQSGYFTPPLPIGPVLPQLGPLASVFVKHPFVQQMKDEWWKGVGSMLSDIQRHQLYQQFGVNADPGYNYNYSSQANALDQSGVAYNQQGQSQGYGAQSQSHTSSVMVKLISAIGLLSSFMLLAFIGIQIQKNSRILSGALPTKVHIRNPVSFINPNKLPAVKGRPATYPQPHRPAKRPGHKQHQIKEESSKSQEAFTQSMEIIRDKIQNDNQPYNVHIHFKGTDVIGSPEENQDASKDGENNEDKSEDEEGDDQEGDEAEEKDADDQEDDETELIPRRKKKPSTTVEPSASAPPFDASFEAYLANAGKVRVVNNPGLILKRFSTTPAAPTPVYRRASPPTTAPTPPRTTARTTTTTRRPRTTRAPPKLIATTRPSTTTTTSTTSETPLEQIESEETIITNTNADIANTNTDVPNIANNNNNNIGEEVDDTENADQEVVTIKPCCAM